MQTTGFQEAVEAVSRDDARYHSDAYLFLKEALEATLKRRKKSDKTAGGHVQAAELLEGFRMHALGEFGPMALTVLEYWGVRGCEDVGQMVFNLVQAGVFGATEEDTLEGFMGAYDFHAAFVAPFKMGKISLNAGASDAVRSEE